MKKRSVKDQTRFFALLFTTVSYKPTALNARMTKAINGEKHLLFRFQLLSFWMSQAIHVQLTDLVYSACLSVRLSLSHSKPIPITPVSVAQAPLQTWLS